MTDDPVQFPAWFTKVFQEMKVAFDSERDPGEKRRLWLMQLDVAIGIVDRFDVDSEGLSEPLSDLRLALKSLEFGATEPELKPRKIVGRPQVPRAAMFRGLAAASAAALIRGGFSAPFADALMAAGLDRSGYRKPSGGRIIAATITGWRKEAREGDRGDCERLVYDLLLEPHLLDEIIDELRPVFDRPKVPPHLRRGFAESLVVFHLLCSISHPQPLTCLEIQREK